jgi:signal transduction histidine kinase
MAKFQARARALDMLGRQQIAGIPTAISELFKNAHDAYANEVIVDYFRSDKLFVLRDDGYGMTREDFEEKWLTLGTESKLNQIPDKTLPNVLPGNERPVLGEKGIGRLAIASIGDHVLVLSRAKRKDGLHDLVMSFVYWKMFEIPGINLDQVHIPIKTLGFKEFPNEKDFEELSNEVIDNIIKLRKQNFITEEESLNLLRPLEKMSLVVEKIDSYLEGPSLKEIGHGTHFFICPADEMLELSIDGDDNDDKASPLLKALIGFSNTMFPDSPKSKIKTSFRDHKTDEYFIDHITENQFWTPDEYLMADHHIKGEFDKYGQFKGSVKVYEKDFPDHIISWKGNNGLPTKCGPFKVDIAYAQGNPKHTIIPTDEWPRLSKKLIKISGIYLFKDDIRLLPYGDNEFDWLDVELNRNKSAGYYFFSYRRMFGAISINQFDNPDLKEKAGREGLRENVSYKQFIGILKNLFLQLASDFFRETELWKGQAGPLTEHWSQERERISQLHKAREEFEKKARTKKTNFSNKLDSLFEDIKEKKYQSTINDLLSNAKRDLEYCITIKDKDKAILEYLGIEKRYRRHLNEIWENYRIAKPRGISIGKLIQDYNIYQSELVKIEHEYINPSKESFENLFNEYQNKLEAEISRRKRLEIAIDETISQYKKETSKEAREVQETAKKISKDVIDLSKQLVIEFENKVRTVQNDVAKLNPYEITDISLVTERTRLENELVNEASEMKLTLDNIRSQLENIVITEDFSNLDYTQAIAEDLESLEDKIESDLELSQLGLAVSAIQHEFSHTTKVIKEQIRRLKAWADLNDGLHDIYNLFQTNFDHLDNYLGLFTPLSRRSHKKKVEIYGNDIFEFVRSVFYARIDKTRHDITIECSKSFSKNIIIGYPSTFYPVFVNIVDNAIFWLKDKPSPRHIYMDADNMGVYISNNGPEIDVRDRDRIFELGFTRKPLGRGMGLYISKQVLNKIEYDISIINPKLDTGVTFKIFKKSEIKQ